MPNLTLFFDIDPAKGLTRIGNNDSREVNRLDLENMNFHQKVYEGYHLLAERFKDRFRKINAENSLEIVTSEVLQIIEEHIESK